MITVEELFSIFYPYRTWSCSEANARYWEDKAREINNYLAKKRVTKDEQTDDLQGIPQESP